MKERFKKYHYDTNLEKAKSIIRHFSEPLIMYELERLIDVGNTYHGIKNEIKTVVTGGSAVSAWLRTDSTFTGDFDIRVVAKRKYYTHGDPVHIDNFVKLDLTSSNLNRSNINNLPSEFIQPFNNHINIDFIIDDTTRNIIESISLVLNYYLDSDINFFNSIQNKLSEVGYSLINNNGNIFRIHRNNGIKLSSIIYSLVPLFPYNGNGIVNCNIVDVLPISNGSIISDLEYKYFYEGDLFSNSIEHDNSHQNSINFTEDDFPIPYFMHHGVPFATLGYSLWDLDRMIKYEKKELKRITNTNSIIYPLSKLKRYKHKKLIIQQTLNNTPMNLNCQALQETIESCKSEFNDGICYLDGLPYDVDDLIELGISENLFPNEEFAVEQLQNMGVSYLCDFIHRSRI